MSLTLITGKKEEKSARCQNCVEEDSQYGKRCVCVVCVHAERVARREIVEKMKKRRRGEKKRERRGGEGAIKWESEGKRRNGEAE